MTTEIPNTLQSVAKAMHDNYFAHSWESETDGAAKECMHQAALAAIRAFLASPEMAQVREALEKCPTVSELNGDYGTDVLEYWQAIVKNQALAMLNKLVEECR